MKQRFLVYVMFLTCCGIPSDEILANLNAPRNLVIVPTTDGTIQIQFTAYNPEPLFLGYNIYMNASSENELRLDHSRHVMNGRTDTIIQQRAIVINTTRNNYPTLQESDTPAIRTARQLSISISYTITKAPNNQPFGSIKWFIAVSAFSSNNIESNLTNVVQVP